MNDIKQQIVTLEHELINFRQQLHKYPELFFKEFKTTEMIANELEKEGISYRLLQPTGIIADIFGADDKKTIALRADMDALNMQELNDELPYKSQIDEMMHGCGHDAHTAMLLYAAKILNKNKELLNGNVRLLFQPAEEVGEGAKFMISQGAMKDVNQVFGLHVWPELPTGKMSCISGPSFAAMDILTVSFEGKGGHGAMPHECIDAAVVASSFVQNIQSIVARETNPLDPVVVTIGKMEVGTRFNIIAQRAILEGTIRTFSQETRETVEKAINRYAQGLAQTYRCNYNIEYKKVTQPLINDKSSAALASNVITKIINKDADVVCPPTMGGEDFGYFLDYAPGCFALLGCSHPENKNYYSIHHGKFNLDDNCLKYGVELLTKYAIEYLSQDDF